MQRVQRIRSNSFSINDRKLEGVRTENYTVSETFGTFFLAIVVIFNRFIDKNGLKTDIVR